MNWIIVSIWYAAMSSDMVLSVMGPFFPPEADRRGISLTNIGLIMSTYALGYYLPTLFIGPKIEKIGHKKILMAGIIIQVFVYSVFGFVSLIESNYNFALSCFVLRFLHGVGGSFVDTLSNTLITHYFPDKMQRYVAINELLSGMGMIFGYFSGIILFNKFGFIAAFQFYAVLLALPLPFVYYYLPPDEASKHAPSSTLEIKQPMSAQTDGAIKLDLTRMFIIPRVSLAYLSLFAAIYCNAVLQPILSVHMDKTFPDLTGQTSKVFGALSFAYLLVGLFISVMPQRLDKRSYMVGGVFMYAIAASLVGPLYITEMFQFPEYGDLVSVGVVLTGLGLGLIRIPSTIEFIEATRDHTQSSSWKINDLAATLGGNAFGLASIMGRVSGGFFADFIGYRRLWTGIVVMFLILLGLYISFFREERSEKRTITEDTEMRDYETQSIPKSNK